MARHVAIVMWAFMVLPASAEKESGFRLAVLPEIEASGVIAYLLPRFALKTGRRVVLVRGAADASIGLPAAGALPVMARGDAVYALALTGENPVAQQFSDWLTSDIGQRAIAAFQPESGPGFAGVAQDAVAVAPVFDGDAALGARVAGQHCGRCHRTRADGTGIGIGSTPSFMALRALPDWAERFIAFYAVNPHPSFLRVTDVSPPFDPARPPAIVPVEITLDEVQAVQAYVWGLAPADLGAPVEAK